METSPKTPQINLYDLIEEAYTKGASDVEMCRILKMRPSDFEAKYNSDKHFRELIDIGRMMRKAYWMDIGRQNLFNPKFNRNLWLDFMKNEFGWAEKSEVKTTEREKSMDELALELGPKIKALIEIGALRDPNNVN